MNTIGSCICTTPIRTRWATIFSAVVCASLTVPAMAGTSNCCTAWGGLGCDDPTCQDAVCAVDSFCCDIAWDGICASEAFTFCSDLCTLGACDPPLTCPKGASVEDEPDCGIPTDSTNGGCNSITGCVGSSGNCCTAWGGIGCEDTACQDAVCAIDSFCCAVAWDGICASEACADDVNCDCAPPKGDFFTDIACGDTVCGTGAFDGATRDTDWYEVTTGSTTELIWTVTAEFPVVVAILDGNCPPFAYTFVGGGACAPLTTSACLPAGTYRLFVAPDFVAPVACPSDYVATLTCNPCEGVTNDACEDRIDVENGTTDWSNIGSTSDGPSNCGLMANDVWFNYTADCTGTVIFDTFGSGFDTVLNLYDGCECPVGASLGCNDDSGGTFQSQVTIDVTDGNCYKIQLGGFNGAVGVGVLNITKSAGPPSLCPADIAPAGGDGQVNAADLGELLSKWGNDCGGVPVCGPCPADIAPAGVGDGVVNAADLGELLANWGPCCDGIDENEKNCGLPIDTVNGGCNSAPVGAGSGNCCVANGGLGCEDDVCEASVCAIDPFCCDTAWDGICAGEAAADPNCDCVGKGFPVTPIECGQTACGSGAFDGALRDTDWYEVTVGEDTELTWTVTAEFQSVLFIINDACPPVILAGAAIGLPGTTVSLSECVGPGTYRLFVAPDFVQIVDCPTSYVATLTCKPCVPPVICGKGNPQDCLIGGGAPGCSDAECCETVCAIDSFCCQVAWDGICVGEALDLCGGGGSNCCFANGGLGCDDAVCTDCVCGIDPFCCDVAWDGICAGEAADPGVCGPSCPCGG